MEKGEAKYHIVSYKTYVLVWAALVILTVITVTVAGMDLGRLSIYTALLIALTKSGLVLQFFMHLKYEQGIFKVMFFITIITLTIFIGFTFFDISYR